MISIVFPHAMNEENDAVLKLKLDMLKDNATRPYELLILNNMGRTDLVYAAWDWMMRNAKYELILWDNSDIVYAPNFMENVIKHKDDGDWIGLELVECGAMEVAKTNIHKNFGTTAKTFDRSGFESWVGDFSKDRPSKRDGFCWYSPSVWKKDWYIKTGGFDLTYEFTTHPTDIYFRERIQHETKFIVVNSFAYHFQRAVENRNQKPERT